MGSTGTVTLREIWDMLEVCAPGHTREPKTHNWRMTFGTKVFPTLPVGEHGARKSGSTEIQVGVVKKMARELGILECAKNNLPQLR